MIEKRLSLLFVSLGSLFWQTFLQFCASLVHLQAIERRKNTAMRWKRITETPGWIVMFLGRGHPCHTDDILSAKLLRMISLFNG